MTTAFKNRRNNKNKTIKELFQIKNRKLLLIKEKREEERKKIIEVESQDKTYYYTVFSCIAIIILFSILAIFGGYNQ